MLISVEFNYEFSVLYALCLFQVCRKCVLKESCRFVNQSIWKGQKNLNLAVVMRVITKYALESVPPQLAVPDEVKASVSRLLKEVINLSETTHKATSTTSV